MQRGVDCSIKLNIAFAVKIEALQMPVNVSVICMRVSNMLAQPPVPLGILAQLSDFSRSISE